MTVLRGINCAPNMLPATHEKVDAAIAPLGYVPNPAARSLAGGQQCRIALLHTNPGSQAHIFANPPQNGEGDHAKHIGGARSGYPDLLAW
jgi:DNA-binding LacI/PurR family transcriptional regulator